MNTTPTRSLAALMVGLAGIAVLAVHAAEPPAPGKVVVSGTVPDETTRQAVLTRAREVWGIDRVVDQLGVGTLVAPPNWSGYVQKLLTPELKQVTRGQISIAGNVVDIKGEVANEVQRQQIVSNLVTQLNTTYTVRNNLRVGAAGQQQVDSKIGNRIVEFEPASAQLTAQGRQLLDELVPVLKGLAGSGLEVTGHTDALGGRPQNIALSAARADAVKAYLVGKGIGADTVNTSGAGPDRPVASNDTPEGRARNRRIEFRVVQR